MSVLVSKKVEEAIAAANNLDLAEFSSVHNKLSPNLGGEGSNLSVNIRPPSQMWVGSSKVPDTYQKQSEKQVNLFLNNYSVYDALNTVERSADLIDEKEQVYTNLNLGLQLGLKTQFLNTALASANIVINGTSNAGYPVQMSDLGLAIAAVRTYGLADKVSALIPDIAMSFLNGSGSTRFYSPKKQDDLFDNKLGSFAGADVISTIVDSTRQAAAGLPTSTNAASVEGDTYVRVAATSAVIPAGTMFTISGVYALDIRGNQVINPQTGAPALASFATPVDVPVGSTALPIGKALFVNGGASASWRGQPYSNGELSVGAGVAFVSALPASGATITQTNAGKRAIAIYGDRAMAVATATPSTTDTNYETTISQYGVAYKFMRQGDPYQGVTHYRMDAVAGFSGVYAPAAAVVLF